VRRLVAELLRRHVERAADQRARRRLDAQVIELREPEVDHLHHARRRDQEVLGLDVAVDDAPIVRGRHAVARLDHPPHEVR